MKHHLFISDLHLDAHRVDIVACFLQFLRDTAPQAEALYILGDLFEAWVGDDDPAPYLSPIKTALRACTDAGCPIYCMRGNRDFLMGPRFFAETGCQELSDPTVIDLYGKSTLLMHGDDLCTLDKKHMRFKRTVHSPWRCWMRFGRHSLKKRQALAEKARHASKNHTATAPDHILDVTPQAVTDIMEQYRTSLLIHGHTHRPAVHELTVSGQPAERVVLGSWGRLGNALRYDTTGAYRLIAVPPAPHNTV